MVRLTDRTNITLDVYRGHKTTTQQHQIFMYTEAYEVKTKQTRTVRKSDYTPALALPKHMAGIFHEKCIEKEKYREEQIGECPFSIPRHNLSL